LHRQDTASLNAHALGERISTLGFKQYWIAERIGVDKLTVNRWLTGKVKRISRDNLARLARLLDCGADDLVYSDETDIRATRTEQSQAAQLLLAAESKRMFGQSEEYALYEKLLKAVMHPNMSLSELCSIYGQLTIVAARLGDLPQTQKYAQLTLDYAQRCGDVDREFSARANLIATDGDAGKLVEARRALEYLVSFAESVGNLRGRAVAQINLMHAYRLLGDLRSAIKTGNDCLSFWLAADDKVPLIQALFFCANTARDLGEYEQALSLRRYALETGGADVVRRGELTSQVFILDLRSLLGETAAAHAELLKVLEEFKSLRRVQDAEGVIPAGIMRRASHYRQASEYLEEYEAQPRLGPYEKPFITEERARLAAAQNQWKPALRLRLQANREFEELGMSKRCTEDPGLDTGMLLERPARLRLIDPRKQQSNQA